MWRCWTKSGPRSAQAIHVTGVHVLRGRAPVAPAHRDSPLQPPGWPVQRASYPTPRHPAPTPPWRWTKGSIRRSSATASGTPTSPSHSRSTPIGQPAGIERQPRRWPNSSNRGSDMRSSTGSPAASRRSELAPPVRAKGLCICWHLHVNVERHPLGDGGPDTKRRWLEPMHYPQHHAKGYQYAQGDNSDNVHARPPEHATITLFWLGLWLQPEPPTNSRSPDPTCPGPPIDSHVSRRRCVPVQRHLVWSMSLGRTRRG
jgi:hypothetical protein